MYFRLKVTSRDGMAGRASVSDGWARSCQCRSLYGRVPMPRTLLPRLDAVSKPVLPTAPCCCVRFTAAYQKRGFHCRVLLSRVNAARFAVESWV